MRHHHDQVQITRRRTDRQFHVMLTVLTFGAWAVTGWPIAVLCNRLRGRHVRVTRTR